MKFVYPNTTSTFTGNEKTAIKAGYMKIEDEIYSDLVSGKKKWSGRTIVPNPNYEREQAQKEEAIQKRNKIREIYAQIMSLKRWFNNNYRVYLEKFDRFEALGIEETVYDPIRNKTYTTRMELYQEAEVVRSEIKSLENNSL